MKQRVIRGPSRAGRRRPGRTGRRGGRARSGGLQGERWRPRRRRCRGSPGDVDDAGADLRGGPHRVDHLQVAVDAVGRGQRGQDPGAQDAAAVEHGGAVVLIVPPQVRVNVCTLETMTGLPRRRRRRIRHRERAHTCTAVVASGAGDRAVPSRGERKERTRRAILDAALRLCEDSSLVALSLRQVAKEVGIVPTRSTATSTRSRSSASPWSTSPSSRLRAMLRDVRRDDPASATSSTGPSPCWSATCAGSGSHFTSSRASERRAAVGARRDPPPDRARSSASSPPTSPGCPAPTAWSPRTCRCSRLIVTAMVATAEDILPPAASPTPRSTSPRPPAPSCGWSSSARSTGSARRHLDRHATSTCSPRVLVGDAPSVEAGTSARTDYLLGLAETELTDLSITTAVGCSGSSATAEEVDMLDLGALAEDGGRHPRSPAQGTQDGTAFEAASRRQAARAVRGGRRRPARRRARTSTCSARCDERRACSAPRLGSSTGRPR